MKIYDCFPFFNELELLEIRLNTLYNMVDYFVISECTHTFTGKEKELYFKNNFSKFNKFKDKIIYSIVDDSPPEYSTAAREIFQKNSILNPLKECNDEDIIMISDIDEIPNPKILSNVIKNVTKDNLQILMQNFYYYYLNNYIEEDYFGNTSWHGTRVSSFWLFKQLNVNNIRNQQLTGINPIKILNGGWHFSFLGGKEKIIEKLNAYAHQEYNTDKVRSNIENNMECLDQDLFFRKMKAKTVNIDDSYPDYLLQNIDKYIHLVRK
jgi:beta-1,4-mannosyl-glycoprotein beta-1,4-N-acetylglucosaminyltransferase